MKQKPPKKIQRVKKVKAQKNFTFSKYRQEFFPIGYIPTAALTIEDEFKTRALRKGYLVKNIRRMYVVIADVARANVPRAERERMQKQLDEMRPTTTYKLPLQAKQKGK